VIEQSGKDCPSRSAVATTLSSKRSGSVRRMVPAVLNSASPQRTGYPYLPVDTATSEEAEK